MAAIFRGFTANFSTRGLSELPMQRSQAPILEPCDADWEGMSPRGAGSRWCEQCERKVHDLSAMTLAEGEALLADERASCCVRYAWDERGEVLVFRRSSPLVQLRRPRASVNLDVGMQLSSAALLVPGAMVS